MTSIASPTPSHSHPDVAYWPVRTAGQPRVVHVRLRRDEGSATERTYEAAFDLDDLNPGAWHNTWVSTYGNTSNGQGAVNDYDLNGILDEVAGEAIDEYLGMEDGN